MTRLFRLSMILTCLLMLATLAPAVGAAPPAMPLADGYLGGCTGEYFNNTTLAGSPVLVRTDGAVNFFWPEGTSPGPGVNINQYSVRWTCSVNAPSTASYTFTMTADDGMNVLVDGNLIMWAWYDQGPSTYSQTITLNAGVHTVVIQYYNDTLGGTAQVTSSLGTGSTSTSFPDWEGDYFNNQTLSGAPTISRDDPNINFNWGYGSPDPSIPVDYFSVRWTRTLNFAGGTWQFTTTTDDGVRLWVDGNLLIDQWHAQLPTAYSANITLAAGLHTVRMEYFDNTGGALAQLNYAQVSSGGTANPVVGVWVGQYYNNISLSGSPVFLLNTPGMNFGFNWGYGSPDPSVPVDNFSAKWDAYQNIPTTGYYTIIANSDDGMRVWLDGALVIDGWFDHSSTTFTATRNLGAGLHAFHVEYYERTGTALVSVQIVPGLSGPPGPGSGQGILPNLGLGWQTGGTSTGGEVIVNNLGPGWQAGGASTGWHGAATGINGHAFWTFNNTYATPYHNWARWYPTLGAPRNYEVFAYIPAGLGSTLNARYEVYHAGRYNLAPRSQAFYANQWMSLGTYNFRGAGGEFVLLSDVTSECHLCRKLAFDAIRFSPR